MSYSPQAVGAATLLDQCDKSSSRRHSSKDKHLSFHRAFGKDVNFPLAVTCMTARVLIVRSVDNSGSDGEQYEPKNARK